jgi:hypothetical protein
MDVENDSKLLSVFPWPIIFKRNVTKYNCLHNMKV